MPIPFASTRPLGTSAALWDRYRSTADPDARDLLLQHYVSLVHFVARRMAARVNAVEYDELVSAGSLGLLRALRAYDGARGMAFSTYAVPCIRGAMLDELRCRDWMPRSSRARSRRLIGARDRLQARLQRPPTPGEVAGELGLDLPAFWRWCDELGARSPATATGDAAGVDEGRAGSQVYEPATAPDQLPDHWMMREEKTARLRAAVDQLPERERRVLALCYFEELTMKQVGAALGVTESRICQIRQRALGRLRATLTPSLHT